MTEFCRLVEADNRSLLLIIIFCSAFVSFRLSISVAACYLVIMYKR